jgi:kynurenine formamidase
VIDLSTFRIIDLSYELLPGERKTDGRYVHGEPLWGRPIELDEFFAYGARMHFLSGQTHGGTHVEAPYKYADDGTDVGAVPLESYIGEAVVCSFAHKAANAPISADELREAGVKQGDILLAWASAETSQQPPFFTVEAVDWLLETRIKMLGIENLRASPPDTPHGPGDADCRLLLGGVALLDAPLGLHRITKHRVFVIALPLKLRRATASWTRAIALEPVDRPH